MTNQIEDDKSDQSQLEPSLPFKSKYTNNNNYHNQMKLKH